MTYDRPRNAEEVPSFLGIAGYYRTFVPMFSLIAESLHKLTRNGVHFEMGEKKLRAFNELMENLPTSTAVVRWDLTTTPQAHMDACKRGIRAELKQEVEDVSVGRLRS